MTPHNTFLQILSELKEKEQDKDIWKDSPYRDLVTLQSNNVGVFGESLIQSFCVASNIKSAVNGVKTKKIGGGDGDGVIKKSTVEIKTSTQGSSNSDNFQHELGEKPWNSDFMIFLDISPKCIYLTIFKNFTEEFYKSGSKCEPFPTRKVTWRKKSGAFKLDTSVKINEESIKLGNTIKITQDTDSTDIGNFINSKID